MSDRDPLDVEAIKRLIAANHELTVELQKTTADLGTTLLRIEQLERLLAGRGDRHRVDEFERVRATALANGHKGAFSR